MSDRSEIYRLQNALEAVDPESAMGNELAFITAANPVVLDVGCACGDFGAMLKRERNAEMYGLEYVSASIEIASSTGAYKRIDQQDLDSLTKEDYSEYRGKFDYIVCGDVLEHLRDPMRVLSILKTYLKAQGRIVASIPNVAHMSVKANLLRNTFDYMPVGLLDETHIHLFSHKSISEGLASVGLRIVDCRFTMQEKEGLQPHRPFEQLPTPVLKLIFEDWHSYVCQYVMLICPDPHPEATLSFLNTLAIQVDETTAPASIRGYRERLIEQYLSPVCEDSPNLLQIVSDEQELREKAEVLLAEARAERVKESEAREKLIADYRKLEISQLNERNAREKAEVLLAEARAERAKESAAREKLIADYRKLEVSQQSERSACEKVVSLLAEARAERAKESAAREKLIADNRRLELLQKEERNAREKAEVLLAEARAERAKESAAREKLIADNRRLELSQMEERNAREKAEALLSDARAERTKEEETREKLISDNHKLEALQEEERAAREQAEIQLAALREECARLRVEVVELNKACDRWATDKVRADKEKLEAERLLLELKASPSWRITAPLRFIKRKSKGAIARLKHCHTELLIWHSERRLCKSIAGSEIVFDHNLGGGANDYRDKYVAARLSEGVPILVFHNNLEYYQNRDFTIRIYTPTNKDGTEYRFDSWAAVRVFISHIRFSRIVYNNLVYNPEVGEIVKWIGSQRTNLLMMIHDFYSVCQFYLMTTVEGRYCQGKDCDACAKTQNDQRHLFGTLRSADDWRRLWSPLFERAEEIRVFSPFATKVLEIFHPGVSARVVCVPHDMSYFKGTAIELDKGTGLKVGVVGSIYNVAKGAKVVEDYARALPDDERLTIIGTYDGAPCEKLEITGRYSLEELGSLLVRHGINVVFFPSVCPETFSYTVSELMQMRVPIVAFDVGAQGCKVAEYDRGVVITEQTVQSVRHAAQTLYDKVYGGMK